MYSTYIQIYRDLKLDKVLFLDLDGTLTNDDKKVTPKTLKALKQIMEEGHIVALASGRPTPGVAQVAKTLELISTVDMFFLLMEEK